MQNKLILLSSLSCLLFAPNASHSAPINKCTDASGKITYSDSPCPSSNKAAAVKTNPKPTIAQELDAKLRQQQELSRAAQGDLRIAKEDLARQRRLQAIEEKERKCALMKIEVDRRMNNAAYYGNDPWWRNQAVASAREYKVECGQ